MPAKVDPIPKNENRLAPYLIVSNAAEMIAFYTKVFGASEEYRLEMPDGRIGHAQLKIGDATIMLSDEFADMGFLSPRSIGAARSPVSIHLYVEDVDAVYKNALAAGATSMREPADQFYGDRNAQVRDPSGHGWDLATHLEDVTPDEMKKRMAKLGAQ